MKSVIRIETAIESGSNDSCKYTLEQLLTVLRQGLGNYLTAPVVSLNMVLRTPFVVEEVARHVDDDLPF